MLQTLKDSFHKNPVLWCAGVLAVALYVHNGISTKDWTPSNLSTYFDVAMGIVAAVVARAHVYSPATVDEFANATDYVEG